jgi:mannose-6-phosphate isomerase class I
MRKPNYDKYPHVEVPGNNPVWTGYESIIQTLKETIADSKRTRTIVAVDCYPGVLDAEVKSAFQKGLNPALTIDTLDLKRPEETVRAMIERNLTDDRVFGVLSCHNLEEFLDPEQIDAARRSIERTENGLVLIYGVGASLVQQPDLLVYADMARWEIQMRFRRKQIGNWGVDNLDEDVLRRYKRGFFVEWRAADRHKKTLFDRIDYLLDTNIEGHPKMISGKTLLAGLEAASVQPFRVVPFFDPAPWGGQWMKEVCDLDRAAANYGWCFDCVPEENSLLLKVGDTTLEIPSINLVFRHPVALLGHRVHARFGAEFPIRFDFLDTMGGGHLSFQVHPLTEYIQETFGMHYTQDESYYMLDAGDDAVVYLGMKEGVDPQAMIRDLETAQTHPEKPFNDELYVNQWPAKKHDHFLIPAGTPHCSGNNGMVLEISATPYIFTFKLWDWGRLGLDGLPRPVHVQHGKKVIQWDRTTQWVKDNLINRVEPITSGDGWREERTGLHEREFIETRRHWFTKKVLHHTNGIVNVLNLIEGEEALIESPDGTFEPYIVHYAETFIVPAAVGAYTIRPHGPSEGTECATIKAYVRG